MIRTASRRVGGLRDTGTEPLDVRVPSCVTAGKMMKSFFFGPRADAVATQPLGCCQDLATSRASPHQPASPGIPRPIRALAAPIIGSVRLGDRQEGRKTGVLFAGQSQLFNNLGSNVLPSHNPSASG